MNKSCIINKQFEPSTNAHDTKGCEICGDKFKIEKEINNHLTQRHKNSSDPFSVKCAYDKCTEEEVCDSCLD